MKIELNPSNAGYTRGPRRTFAPELEPWLLARTSTYGEVTLIALPGESDIALSARLGLAR
jgi:hypothetical protein